MDDEFKDQNRNIEVSDGGYEWVTLKSEPEHPPFIPPEPEPIDIDSIEPLFKQRELHKTRHDENENEDDV
jgi:hypothetical protein